MSYRYGSEISIEKRRMQEAVTIVLVKGRSNRKRRILQYETSMSARMLNSASASTRAVVELAENTAMRLASLISSVSFSPRATYKRGSATESSWAVV